MPDSLRAEWIVTAGIIVGKPIPEFTKVFFYNDTDYEEDIKKKDPNARGKFTKTMEEAYDYAKSMNNPLQFNWIKVEWIWI